MSNKITLDTLREMELHKTVNLTGCEIFRVPGGWLYRYWNYSTDELSETPVFVPEPPRPFTEEGL